MAQKQKAIKFVTPAGELLYPYLDKAEEYKGKSTGKLSAQLRLSEENTKAFIAKMQGELRKAAEAPEFRGMKWSKTPKLGDRKDKNGDILFKYKTNEIIKTKDGDVKRKVPIFDAKGKPLTGAKLGHGSTVKIAGSAFPYYESEDDNGFRVYLDAIQVLELKEYGAGNASGFGFDKEDGYEAEETGAEVFEDNEEMADSEGDF